MDIVNRDKVLITGDNGSGKSTLAKIIVGLIRPSKGEVIYNINADAIGYYSQSMRLFNRSLLKNISYPDADVDRQVLIETLEDVNLKSLLDSWDNLLLQKPGDLGDKLSGVKNKK